MAQGINILGITPTCIIPKPIGARIVVVPITTTLTIEERAAKSGLTMVLADKSRPRQTVGIIVAVSIDPIIQENFRVGMGVYFSGLSGINVSHEGKEFRSLEFNEVVSTLEEEEISEAYKQQVRNFLLTPPDLSSLEV